MANAFIEALKRQKLQQMSHQPQPLPPDLLGALADAEGTLYDKSMIYKALKDAVTLPGRAWRGEAPSLYDYEGRINPKAVEEAMNTAGMAQLGGIPGGARGPGSVGMSSRPKGWVSGWETRIDQPYLEGPPAPKRPRDTWGGYSTPEEYQAAQAAKQTDDAEWAARVTRAQRDILNGASRSPYQNGDPSYRVYDRIAQDVPPYLKDRPRNALGQEIPPTPYELAHMEAQRVAALPIEQGGLGLPPGNTAMERARAMGFDTDAYHGSPTGRIRKFGLSRFNGESSFNSFAPDVNVANEYVTGAADWPQIGMKKIIDYNGTIYPVKLNRRNAANPKDVGRIAKKAIDNDEYIGELSDIEQYMPLGKDDEIRHWRYVEDQNLLRKIKNEGYTGFETTENRYKGFKDKYIAYGVNDPTTIRSRFAAFDPARRDSADLLATLAPYAIASPLLAGNLYDYLSQE